MNLHNSTQEEQSQAPEDSKRDEIQSSDEEDSQENGRKRSLSLSFELPSNPLKTTTKDGTQSANEQNPNNCTHTTKCDHCENNETLRNSIPVNNQSESQDRQSKVCSFFKRNKCIKGTKCAFIHPECTKKKTESTSDENRDKMGHETSRSKENQAKRKDETFRKKLCRFYLRGKCKHGKKECKYDHQKIAIIIKIMDLQLHMVACKVISVLNSM